MAERLHEFPGLKLSLTKEGVSIETGAVHWWNTITRGEKYAEYLEKMTPELHAEIVEARGFIREHFPDIEERAEARRAGAEKSIRDSGAIE